jgi:YVTN family beta-propeller protein
MVKISFPVLSVFFAALLTSGSYAADKPIRGGTTADMAAALAVPPAPVPAGRAMTGLRKIATVYVANGPKSLEFMPDGQHVWTNNLYGNATQMIEAASGRVVRTMPWSGEPVEAAFRNGGKEAWISLYNKNAALVINTETGGLDATIKTGIIPKVVAVSPDERWVYVANWRPSGGRYSVSVIDAVERKKVHEIPMRQIPRGIAFMPSGKIAYVAVMGGSQLAKVNVEADHKVIGHYPVGAGPRHVVTDRAGSMLYVSLNSAGRVVKYSTKADKVLAAVRTGSQPRTIELSADERYLFVCNNKDNSLSIVDTATMKEVTKVRTGHHPIGVAAAPDGRRVWVANYAASTLWVYDAIYEGENQVAAKQ